MPPYKMTIDNGQSHTHTNETWRNKIAHLDTNEGKRLFYASTDV